MKLKYKIELLSDWHCGAGTDSGAESNALVIKDLNRLPYVPGKTVKGLLKDSLLDINDVVETSIQDRIDTIFGKVNKNKSTESGIAFFSNAELDSNEKKEIIANDLVDELYRNIASTAISPKSGVAQANSLRGMEVCMPLTLHGQVEGINESHKELLIKAFKWTRHLGVNRNRGLGRCQFSVVES